MEQTVVLTIRATVLRTKIQSRNKQIVVLQATIIVSTSATHAARTTIYNRNKQNVAWTITGTAWVLTIILARIPVLGVHGARVTCAWPLNNVVAPCRTRGLAIRAKAHPNVSVLPLSVVQTMMETVVVTAMAAALRGTLRRRTAWSRNVVFPKRHSTTWCGRPTRVV